MHRGGCAGGRRGIIRIVKVDESIRKVEPVHRRGGVNLVYRNQASTK